MLEPEKRIKTKKQLKEWLDYELPKYGNNKLVNMLAITEMAIVRKHQYLLRKTEYCINTNKHILGAFYKIRLFKLQNKHALHIPPNCCAKGLRIMHLGPILMNSGVIIGENCAIHMNTSFVAGGTTNSAPRLGNGVVVGVGAVILGGVTIADDVAIGANAVVNKDVLEESIAVAGVPAKKISNNGRSEWNKKAKQEDK